MNLQSVFQAVRLMDKPHPFREVSWAEPVGATCVTHYRDKTGRCSRTNANYWTDFYSQYEEMEWHENILPDINIFIINRKFSHLQTSLEISMC